VVAVLQIFGGKLVTCADVRANCRLARIGHDHAFEIELSLAPVLDDPNTASR
jgi:hypothetical protein